MATPAFPSSGSSSRVSRRLLVGSSLAGAALLPLGAASRAAAGPARAVTSPRRRFQEAPASPAGWRTWLLTSPDELRPTAPGAPSQAEIDEVLAAIRPRRPRRRRRPSRAGAVGWPSSPGPTWPAPPSSSSRPPRSWSPGRWRSCTRRCPTPRSRPGTPRWRIARPSPGATSDAGHPGRRGRPDAGRRSPRSTRRSRGRRRRCWPTCCPTPRRPLRRPRHRGGRVADRGRRRLPQRRRGRTGAGSGGRREGGRPGEGATAPTPPGTGRVGA